MKSTLLFCVTVLSVLNSLAQQRYTPGYIINNNGDTSLVQLQEEYKPDLLSQVKYKKDSLSTAIVIAKPLEIAGFGYWGGGVYKSLSLKDNPKDTNSTIPIFAEQLLTGPYDLFVFSKKDNQTYIIRREQELFTLTKTSYNAFGQEDEIGNFQNQLLFLATACPDLQRTVENQRFSETSLIRFVTDLNRCTNPGAVVINYFKQGKGKHEWVIFAGGIPVNNSFQVLGDAQYRLTYPTFNKKLAFNIGLHYSFKPSVSTARNFGNVLYTIKTKERIISLPLTLQYFFISGRFRPYLSVGFSGAIYKATYSDYTGITETNEFRLAGLGELGMELKITKQIMIKAAYRYDITYYYPVLGLGFTF